MFITLLFALPNSMWYLSAMSSLVSSILGVLFGRRWSGPHHPSTAGTLWFPLCLVYMFLGPVCLFPCLFGSLAVHIVPLKGLLPVLYSLWCWLFVFLYILFGFLPWCFHSVSWLCSIPGCFVLLCAWHLWLRLAVSHHRLCLHVAKPYMPFFSFSWFLWSLSVGWVCGR